MSCRVGCVFQMKICKTQISICLSIFGFCLFHISKGGAGTHTGSVCSPAGVPASNSSNFFYYRWPFARLFRYKVIRQHDATLSAEFVVWIFDSPNKILNLNYLHCEVRHFPFVSHFVRHLFCGKFSVDYAIMYM